MSFNRLDYDMCSYEHTLRESVGPGQYYLTTPPVACGPCHPNDPKYRIQRQGVIPTGDQHSTDVSSDLRNTIRHGSKCPSKKHLPKAISKHLKDPFRLLYKVVFENLSLEPYSLYSVENNLIVSKILSLAKIAAETQSTQRW